MKIKVLPGTDEASVQRLKKAAANVGKPIEDVDGQVKAAEEMEAFVKARTGELYGVAAVETALARNNELYRAIEAKAVKSEMFNAIEKVSAHGFETLGNLIPKADAHISEVYGNLIARANAHGSELLGHISLSMRDEAIKSLEAHRLAREPMECLAGIASRAADMLGTLSARDGATKILENQLLAREPIDRFLGISKQYEEMYSHAIKPLTDQFSKRADEMLGRAIEPFADQFSDLRRDFEKQRGAHLERNMIFRSMRDMPRPTETPNFAEEKIEAIARDEKEKRDNLPIGKSLRMYVIVGGMRFLVSGREAFTAKDKVNIEIETFDGENFQNVNSHYQQIVLMFETVNIESKPETIH